MKIKHVLATAGAALAMAGMTATTAHAAFDITGGDYVGTSDGGLNFTIGGAHTIYCENVTYTGSTDNVPGDPASTMLTPTLSNCDYFGFPVTATTPNPWKLTVDAMHSGWMAFGSLSAPSGTLVKFKIELLGCEMTFGSPSGRFYMYKETYPFAGGRMFLDGEGGIPVTTNGFCSFNDNDQGEYSDFGSTSLPGVEVEDL